MTFCWQWPKLVSDAVGKVLLWYMWVQSHWHPQRLHPCAWVELSLVVALVAPWKTQIPWDRGVRCVRTSEGVAGSVQEPPQLFTLEHSVRFLQRVMFSSQKALFIQIE